MGGNLEKACESVISLQPPMYMIFLRYSLYQYCVELIHFIISLSVKPVQWYVKVGSYFLRNNVSLFTFGCGTIQQEFSTFNGPKPI